MSLSLNIVAHELQKYGQVARTSRENPLFEGVRLFLDSSVLRPAILYVCETGEDAKAVGDAGCFAIRACAADAAPCANAALSVCGGPSTLELLDALLDIMSRYDNWERAMDRVFHSGGSIQDLMDVSEPFLLNNVVVLDPALKLLAYTKGVPCDDSITMQLIEHGYHTEENIRKFKLHKRFKPWSESDGFVINDTRRICKYDTVVKAFNARSAFSLISVMMCNVVGLDDHLLDIFELFVKRVELYAARDYPNDKPSGSAVDSFLKDLINDEIPDDGAITERCKFVGIPFSSRFCLFYLRAGEDSMPSSRLLSDVSLVVAPAKTIVVDDAVVVLCFNCLDDRCALHCIGGSCPHDRRTVSQRLNEMLERYDLTCGRSSKFTSLSSIAMAYKQAKAAYLMSCRKPGSHEAKSAVNAWSRVFAFDAYGVDYLVKQLSADDLGLLDLTYAGSILSTLARQDAEAKTNNYDFLYAYLLYERRTSIVAEKLHMHRNNVGYRISRIEEKLGIDTDDAQLRQDLLFAYRIRNAASMRNAQ